MVNVPPSSTLDGTRLTLVYELTFYSYTTTGNRLIQAPGACTIQLR